MPADSVTSTDSMTIRSYDAIAGNYLDRRRDRSFLERDISGFAALLPDHDFVLDVGCGPGFDAAALRALGVKAAGMDLSWGMLRAGYAKYGGPLLQGDMCRLPIAAGRLSGVWASACLLHLPRQLMPAALTEFHRVLHAHGIMYVSLKLGRGSEQCQSSYGQEAARHFTYWEEGELDDALDAAGFSIVSGAIQALENVTWLVRMARKHD